MSIVLGHIPVAGKAGENAMKATPSPRLPEAIKEAIRQHIAGRTGAAPVQVSRLLRDVRSAVDTTHVTDDELVKQIVMDATDHGLSVHFDLEGG
jgi:hypothetical protein